MPQHPPETYTLPALIGYSTLLVVVTTLHLINFPMTEDVSLYELISEASVTALCFFVLLNLSRLTVEKKAKMLLQLGFGILFLSLLTDTLDELVEQPDIINIIFEDVCLMTGFFFMVLGLQRWIIDNNTQHKNLRKLTTQDELTQILNRSAFYQRSSFEHRRFLRHKSHFSMLLIDMDDFKNINKTFGHEAGDVVLQMVVEAIRSHTRDIDTLARWDGKTFVLQLVDTPLKSGLIVAEKIRRLIESLEILSDNRLISVTSSIGVAEVKSEDADVQPVLERAEEQLNAARTSGGNRVFGEFDFISSSPSGKPFSDDSNES